MATAMYQFYPDISPQTVQFKTGLYNTSLSSYFETTRLPYDAASHLYLPFRWRWTPERVKLGRITVVAANLADRPVLHAHHLADRLVEPAFVVRGRGADDRDDELGPNREVEQASTKGAAAQRPLPREEAIADRGPAAVRAGERVRPGKVPDGVGMEAPRDCGRVPGAKCRVHAANRRHVLLGRHHLLLLG